MFRLRLLEQFLLDEKIRFLSDKFVLCNFVNFVLFDNSSLEHVFYIQEAFLSIFSRSNVSCGQNNECPFGLSDE